MKTGCRNRVRFLMSLRYLYINNTLFNYGIQKEDFFVFFLNILSKTKKQASLSMFFLFSPTGTRKGVVLLLGTVLYIISCYHS
jgi:hypothetical protein